MTITEIDLGRLIDALPGLVWTALPDGRAEYVGRSWLDYTGLSFEEALGAGWTTSVHPDDAARLLAAWSGIIASGELGEVEARLRRHDGVYRWFLFRASPMPDPSGEVVRWCGMNFDIDDHVRAEAAVQAEQLRFERILDGLPVIAALFSRTGKIIFCNRRMLEYLDVTLEEVQARPSAYNYHPDERDEILSEWVASVHEGKPFDKEARLQRGDGVYRWHRTMVFPLRDPAGEIELWYGLAVDVDDAKRAEAASRDHQRRFRQIVDDMPAIVALFAPNGPITFSNKRMLAYHGLTLEQMQAGEAGYTFHPEDRPEILLRYAKAMETGQPFDCEVRLLRADGGHRWHLVQGFPLRDPQGGVDLWCGLFTDVDDARRAQAELAGEKQLLELVASGVPLATALEASCRQVEMLAPDSLCSVLIVAPDRSHFRLGAGPSLPGGYNAALDGVAIDPKSGPCGLAAFQKAPVIGADLANDPRWAGSTLLPLVAEHGLAACWSVPILASRGEVLGTFAVYRRAPATPRPEELELIDRFAKIAGMAIEREQSEAARKAGEAELRRAHDFLTQAQRISKTGSFTWDAHPEKQVWSDEMYRMLEMEPGTVMTIEAARTMIYPDDLPTYDAMVRRGRLGEDMEATYRIVTAKGTVKHVHAVARRLHEVADRTVFMCAQQDVTEAKRAEAALKASEAEIRRANAELMRAYSHITAAQKLSRTGSFTWDVLADEHHWSDELYRIAEIDPGVRIDMARVRECIHPDDRVALEAAIERALADLPFEYAGRIVTPRGAVKHFHIVGHRIEDIADRPVFVGALQDITESWLAEEALGRARAELAHVARVTTLSALTASIAHEVNQPLAGIITNASTCLRMLAADPPNLEGARATAQRTIRDGNRASEVIQRLRALFSRKAPVQERVDLNEAAGEVIALSSSELQANRVHLRIEFAQDLPLVRGDRVQLQQVVLNLVLNAADAMKEVDDRPREMLVRTAADAPDRVTLSVRDAGVGIDPLGLERLFDAFYTTKAEGMGVGLAVSRSIIESHEGRLWAEANTGSGATFAFSLPADLERPVDSKGSVESKQSDAVDLNV